MNVPTHAAARAGRAGRRPAVGEAAALVLIILLSGPAPAPADPSLGAWAGIGRDTVASLAGRVTWAASGRAVPGARVVLPAVGRPTGSDSAGRFRMDGLAAGDRRVRLDLPDGRRTERHIHLAADSVTRLEFRVPEDVRSLEEIRVEVAARRPDFLAGFRRRRQEGLGYFLDRAAIEERQPYQTSDLFRGVPGVQVEFGNGAGPALRMRRFGSRCEPLIYLDGIPAEGLRVDFLVPAEIAALEVYRGVAQLPPQFSRPTQRCGAVLIWTREGERRP